MLLKTKRILSTQAKKVLYFAQIYSHLTYGIKCMGANAAKKTAEKE